MDGLAQYCSKSIANALDLLQSCITRVVTTWRVLTHVVDVFHVLVPRNCWNKDGEKSIVNIFMPDTKMYGSFIQNNTQLPLEFLLRKNTHMDHACISMQSNVFCFVSYLILFRYYIISLLSKSQKNIMCFDELVYSLQHIQAKWLKFAFKLSHHWSRYWLLICLAPRQYPSQRRLMTNWTIRTKLQWNLIFLHDRPWISLRNSGNKLQNSPLMGAETVTRIHALFSINIHSWK